jgi:[NiFe] hydrogenase large subunit/hydrogenase large subunit
VRAVEKALNITIPDNARIIRNLITAIQYVQDHVIHVYHLHALDWVDIVSALSADPKKTAALAQQTGKALGGTAYEKSSAEYFAGVAAKLKEFVERGQLGPFANGYWGHPAYKLPPEANLMAVAHYLEALEWQKDVIRMHATLGAKNPHAQTYIVGGMSVPVDANSQNALNVSSVAFMGELAKKALHFVEKVYIPDVLAVAPFYLDWAGHGEGVGNYMACGEFPLDGVPDTKNYWLPQGIIKGKDLSTVHPLDSAKVMEYVTHSWYNYKGGDDKGLHPLKGETDYNYTGPKPPYKHLDTDKKYSWIKAPRYEDMPMEVGPLARMLVAYGSGHKEVQGTVNLVLKVLGGLPPTVLFSTLGRVAARAVETLIVARKLPGMIDELAANIGKGDYKIADTSKWEPETWPNEAEGYGWHEAPRGALSHWIRIKDQKIDNYQCVVPSTWNGSPRDAKGQRGPYEQALVGTPVKNMEQPIEILRTVHSFDPCMACAVHVVDAEGKPVTRIKVV